MQSFSANVFKIALFNWMYVHYFRKENKDSEYENVESDDDEEEDDEARKEEEEIRKFEEEEKLLMEKGMKVSRNTIVAAQISNIIAV